MMTFTVISALCTEPAFASKLVRNETLPVLWPTHSPTETIQKVDPNMTQEFGPNNDPPPGDAQARTLGVTIVQGCGGYAMAENVTDSFTHMYLYPELDEERLTHAPRKRSRNHARKRRLKSIGKRWKQDWPTWK